MGDRRDIPLPKRPYELSIVLVRPQHPGNLGAICRAMLNFGFDKLCLVNPLCSPDEEEARNRAKHAGRLLDECVIYDSFTEACSDFGLVIGTSGKRESGDKTLFRHFLLPWGVADKLDNYSGKVALVFGEEGMGLATDELQQCDFLLTIPTWEGYPICNLSHSVALTLYELNRTSFISSNLPDSKFSKNLQIDRSLSPELRRLLRQSISEFAKSLEGDVHKKAMFEDNLQRTILRGLPIDNEVQRLIGAFVEATTALQKLSGNQEWMSSRRRRIE